MNAPTGTTQAQADYIFYSQVAAGSLVGFTAGQSISGTTSAAVKFVLSRLDRGTAGVDDNVIVSIVNGLPTISGVPNLVNVPLENPITQANVANISFNNTYTAPAIGPLSSTQVQGILAQIANFVNQSSEVMTNETGIGQYGFNCQQLEQAGYVKPGTYREFIFDPSPLVDVVSAPAIWTGKNGIGSVRDFLNNPGAQNDAMSTLLSNGYNGLTAIGTIVPPITQSLSALSGQVYTQSGLQTISALSAATSTVLSLPTSTTLSLANNPLSNLLSTTISNPGSLASGALNSLPGNFTNISSITSSLRNTVTGSVGALVANAGQFGTKAASLWANSGSLTNIGSTITSSLGSVTKSLNGIIPSDITSLTSNIQNLDILGKASEFATNFSNPLSSLENLGNFDLNNLTSSLPSFDSLTASLPSLDSLTSSIPGLDSLGSLADFGNFGSLASFPGLGDLGSIGGLFGGGGDSLVSATQVAPGYSNTVNRATVDVAFTKILGSPKIPTPLFEYPSRNSISLNASGDISAAQNALAGLQSIGNNILSSVSDIFG